MLSTLFLPFILSCYVAVTRAITVGGPINLICPKDNQTTYQGASGKFYLLECGLDHRGGNLSRTNVNSYTGCANLCDASTTCVAFSYYGGAVGAMSYCYLKSSVRVNVFDDRAWGGKAVSATSSTSSSSSSSSSSTSMATTTSSISSTTTTTSVSTTTTTKPCVTISTCSQTPSLVTPVPASPVTCNKTGYFDPNQPHYQHVLAYYQNYPYTPSQCAQFCHDTPTCGFFFIYVEYGKLGDGYCSLYNGSTAENHYVAANVNAGAAYDMACFSPNTFCDPPAASSSGAVSYCSYTTTPKPTSTSSM